MNKIFKKTNIIIFIIVLIITGAILFVIYNMRNKLPLIDSVIIKKHNTETNKIEVDIKIKNYLFKDNYYCLVTLSKDIPSLDDEEWIKAKNKTCSVQIDNLIPEEYYYFVKDEFNNITNPKKLLSNVAPESLFDMSFNSDSIYLIPNETYKLTPKLSEENSNINIIYNPSNSAISISEDGLIKAINTGTSTITVLAKINNKVIFETNVSVNVTNLINKPKINNSRPFLSCNRYTNSESEMLDKILEFKVKEAGYATRAGVVAAARFLALEFPYRVDYFSENGRLANYGDKAYVDGEGRYYHKGLYLSTNKFKDLRASSVDPAIWGCPLVSSISDIDQSLGGRYSNGLDCSGFMTWIIYNGGFDIGDIGSGPVEGRTDSIAALGTRQNITVSLLKSGQIKPGDIVGFDGHTTLIIGMDDKNIYLTDSLFHGIGIRVRAYTYASLANDRYLDYVMSMEHIYKEDGNLTKMWN